MSFKDLFINILLLLFIIWVDTSLIKYAELCGDLSGRRIYIELGKKGIISAGNHTNSELLSQKEELNKSFRKCKLELISCQSCVINIKFMNAKLLAVHCRTVECLLTHLYTMLYLRYHITGGFTLSLEFWERKPVLPGENILAASIHGIGAVKSLDVSQNCNTKPIRESCPCDRLLIYEPGYDSVSEQQFCNKLSQRTFYKSKSRMLHIVYSGKEYSKNYFLLEYSTSRNHEIIQGSPGQNSWNETNTISSPYFPNRYSTDLNMEYTIRCDKEMNCKVCLVFVDFLIAKASVIEIFDWNGQRLEVATGMMFRPPTIISSGPSLSISFYGNGGTNKGFKALYSFLSDNDLEKPYLKSNMNCGGLVDNLGGGITMMELTKESERPFDCIWILEPPKTFLHFYTHMYIKIVAFSGFLDQAELNIHQGLTSFTEELKYMVYPSSNKDNFSNDEYIVLISKGFYVRFKGSLGAESKLGLAYTAFSYNNCASGSHFLCKNQRCIPVYLQCDGFDHCGDNSDEPVSCFQDMKHRRWSHTTNFLFPKNQYTDLHIAAIIFLVCSFGLVSLIITLIILIFCINNRVNRQRHLEMHLNVINDLLEEEISITQEEIVIDEPPVYEHPPNYNDLGRTKTESRNKQTRNSCSRCCNHLALTPVSRDQSMAGTSGNFTIPNSPPPDYNSLIAATTSEVNNLSISPTGSKHSLFAKYFTKEDFNILKIRILQKGQRRKKRNKNIVLGNRSPGFNSCLSDSELNEMNYNHNNLENRRLLQRSFSFDDYL